MSLKTDCINNYFSHVYVEEKIKDHNITVEILKKLKKSKIIYIKHYKNVFSPSTQLFSYQKNSPKLILAKKEDNYIYEGSDLCHDFNNENFYYTSNILNCFFSCDYCYLQGMYNSANIVVFVNIEDFFKEVDKISESKKIYLTLSYDTDLMAFDFLYPFTKKWIDYSLKNNNLSVEIRTKSILDMKIKNNGFDNKIIFGWTLLPQFVIDNFEKNTPSLEKRIKTIKQYIKNGWKIRISIDPALMFEGWKNVYEDFIHYIGKELKNENISEISIGVFRMPIDYYKKIKKNSNSQIIFRPYYNKSGIISNSYEEKSMILNFLNEKLLLYFDKEKIFL